MESSHQDDYIDTSKSEIKSWLAEKNLKQKIKKVKMKNYNKNYKEWKILWHPLGSTFAFKDKMGWVLDG